MNPLSPSLLATIAGLRCQALAWAEIARRIGCDEVALRQQLANQHAEYQGALALAKDELADELLFAGLAKLKQILTCGKAALEADAAKALLRFAQLQQQQRAKQPRTPPPNTPSVPNTPPPPATPRNDRPPLERPAAQPSQELPPPTPPTPPTTVLRPQRPIQPKVPPLLRRTG